MNRRTLAIAFVIFVAPVFAFAATATGIRSVIGQNTVVPGCPGSGDELRAPTDLFANRDHVLSTTFDVVQQSMTVPIYVKNNNVWTCTENTFNLRLYRDPVSGTPKFPGPTLNLRRATDTTPGDAFNILLQNHLPPSNEECVWAQGNCDCSGTAKPQCCSDTTKPNGMNCFHGDNTTNLHFHGTHASPQKPQDWVLLQLTPFGSPKGSVMHGADEEVTGEFQYAVNPLGKRQSEGTHWYHPHKHGSTALQVGNGMAGALIVRGPFDDWLNAQYKQPLRDKLMVIQQAHDLNFTAPPTQQFNPIPLINGQLVPQVTMYRGEIQRWRLVNANIDATAQFTIDFDGIATGAAAAIQARQIAMDGVQFSPKNYQCQPLLDSTPCDGEPSGLTFQTSPGNRADFLVKAPDAIGEFFIPYEVFGNVQDQGTRPLAGTRRGSGNRQVQRALTREALDAVAPGATQPALLSVNVIDCPAGMECAMEFPSDASWPQLPDFLRPIVPNRPTQKVQFQVLNTQGQPQANPAPAGIFGIRVKGQNDDKLQQFNDQCAAFTAPLDPNGGEEWQVSQNLTRTAPFHVFHIHTNPFQVVSTYNSTTNQKIVYPEPIWMDSITLPSNTNPGDPDNPQGEVVIRQRYEDYTGLYVLHCHFLGHEDRGMMLSVQTVCPNKLDSWSVTSATQQECTFNQFLPAVPPCSATPAAAHAGH